VSGKKISKIFFFPVSAFAGEKKMHCAVQNGTVQFFFFLKKRKKIWELPKMGYDNNGTYISPLRFSFLFFFY
jgi:hypothetical protein